MGNAVDEVIEGRTSIRRGVEKGGTDGKVSGKALLANS